MERLKQIIKNNGIFILAPIILIILSVFFIYNTSNVYAETTSDGIEYAITDAVRYTCSITGYSGSDKDVVIPSEINGYSVTSIKTYAFIRRNDLTSIIIPESVTTIEAMAFSECDSLKKIIIPESVTIIGSYAFGDCSGLTSIKLPETLTIIGERAFYNCVNITNITIPEGITTIGREAFFNCTNLARVSLPESLIIIDDDVFSMQVEYDGFINANITFRVIKDSMIDLWLKQNGFAKIEYVLGLSKGTTFKYGKARYEVTKQGLETSSKKVNPEVLFIEPRSRKLKSITVPSTITVNDVVYKVTTIENGAFKNNKKLKKVVLGSNIKLIKKNAFYGCKKLKLVTFKTKKLSKIGKNAFKGTYKTIQFKCPKSKLKKYKKMLKKAGASTDAKY